MRGGTYHDDNQSSNGDHASVLVIAALDVRMRSILRAKSCRDVVVVADGEHDASDLNNVNNGL